MDNIVDRVFESMERAEADRRRTQEEFLRLFAEPSMKTAKVGDRVVVAAGLIGKGLYWQRTECRVVEVGDTSVKVRFTGDFIDQHDELWIHPALITDVLGPAPVD